MSAMQIYVWDIRHSVGLVRQHAFNQVEMYMLLLSDLRKTYWTADLQHNLFTEALKAIDVPSIADKAGVESSNHQEVRSGVDDPRTDPTETGQPDEGLTPATFEDFLLSFNPFMGMPLQADDLR